MGLKPNILSLLCSLYYFVINLFSRSDVFDFSVNDSDIAKVLCHAGLNKDVIPVIWLDFVPDDLFREFQSMFIPLRPERKRSILLNPAHPKHDAHELMLGYSLVVCRDHLEGPAHQPRVLDQQCRKVRGQIVAQQAVEDPGCNIGAFGQPMSCDKKGDVEWVFSCLTTEESNVLVLFVLCQLGEGEALQ